MRRRAGRFEPQDGWKESRLLILSNKTGLELSSRAEAEK
jgi:hypothetical protein